MCKYFTQGYFSVIGTALRKNDKPQNNWNVKKKIEKMWQNDWGEIFLTGFIITKQIAEVKMANNIK